MKRLSLISLLLLFMIASACTGLRKAPEATASANAAYGVYPYYSPNKLASNKKSKVKQPKIKQLKPRPAYSRAPRGPWTGG